MAMLARSSSAKILALSIPLLCSGCKPPPALANGLGTVGTLSTDSTDASPEMGTGVAVSVAPPDIKVGTQITYQTDSATIAGRGSDWQLNDQGEYINGAGERFDRIAKETTGSAHGFTQYTVIALDDKQAIVTKEDYLSVAGQRALWRSGRSFEAVSNGSGPGNIWRNPADLRKLRPSISENLKIVKGPHRVGDKTLESVSVVASVKDRRDLNTWDLNSGLMLLYNGSLTGKPSAYTAPDENENTGNRLLVTLQFASVRHVLPPWANDPQPEWTKSIHHIEYAGGSVFSATSDTRGAVRRQLSLTVTPGDRGPSWTKLGLAITASANGVSAPASHIDVVTTPSEFDPYWIPPAALARLQPGQILDQDPVVGTSIRVGAKMNGPRGPMLEIIYGTGEFHLGYDLQTGMLVANSSYNAGTHTQTQFIYKSSD